MLLGRTASGLYWMHRYIERAENMARIVDAGLRMALTRTSDAPAEWSSVVVTSGTEDGFRKKHDVYSASTVSDYLLRDGDNPSSVLSCIEAAWSNARMVRTAENQFYVLEDNARTPSGVSYMLENRETMMQLFPELFQQVKVRPVETYPQLLRQSLAAVCPPGGNEANPTIAVLTPGIHNSAYYEHSFLADQMGVHLVEGSDLQVMDGRVVMRMTEGFRAIDVLYRRLDDAFLDPMTFRPDSVLGVAGIMDVYRAGNITIANAPGTGIADDKAIYSYMPEIVEFYTGRKSILENVPTWRCAEPDSLKYVLDHLEELVVKEVHGSGGYGMLVGPAASKKEREEFAAKLKARPGNYIAQPTLALSTTPILTEKGLAPRHVDLRPFVLVSDRIRITPGGLTRVALKEGSLVVNSSQGGGTKDTWVLAD